MEIMIDYMQLLTGRQDPKRPLASRLKAVNLAELLSTPYRAAECPAELARAYIRRMSPCSQATLPEQYDGLAWFDDACAETP